MKIDIDDALLARHQELAMQLIQDDRLGKFEQGFQEQRARHFELERIAREIINVTTAAYYKRGDNENG